MNDPKKLYYEKRAAILVRNLKSRHFDAYYCDNKELALRKALEMIPEGSTVGWGGTMSAQQIGLIDAVKQGEFRCFDRSAAESPEEKLEIEKENQENSRYPVSGICTCGGCNSGG